MTATTQPRVTGHAVPIVIVAIVLLGAIPLSAAGENLSSHPPAIQETTAGGSELEAGALFDRNGSTDGSGAITTSFDTDAEGWQIKGDAQGGGSDPDYVESGGNPDGHICANDDVEGGIWYFSAPPKFLGDQVGAYDGQLQFDLKQSSTDQQFADDDIVLRNETRTIVYDFGNETTHPGTNWTSYSVTLEASNEGWTFASGGEVSSADFRAILANLTELSIRGEYVDGFDRGCLDNVAFSGSASSASFDVTLLETNSPVSVGETLTAEVSIENTGDQAGDRTVTLETGTTVRDTTAVALEARESTTVTLSWTTDQADAGLLNVTVATDNDAAATDVTVIDASEFDVTLLETNSPVTVGETLTVDATIQNTGDQAAVQEVVLSTHDRTVATTEVALDPGQSRTVTLSWATGDGDAGTNRANVSAGSVFDTTSVTIRENTAGISFDNQQVADVSTQAVVVGTASLPSTGFLVVYNASVSTDPDPDRIVGVSTMLAFGEHENVRITLNEKITRSQRLSVVAHNDTNRNSIFDGGMVDQAFTVNGMAVNDTASIRLRSLTEHSTPTSTARPTSTAGTSGPETTGESVPGFGTGITIVAIVSATLFARRKFD